MGLLQRVAAIVAQRLVVHREAAVGDAAALVAGIVAPGGIAARQRRGIVRHGKAHGLGAVDQFAVKAAAAELDTLAIPLRRQVHRKQDRWRRRIHRRDRATHLAVLAQRVARRAGGNQRGAAHGGAAGGQRQLRGRERHALERVAGIECRQCRHLPASARITAGRGTVGSAGILHHRRVAATAATRGQQRCRQDGGEPAQPPAAGV
ncbi:hypothetical protein D9M72_225520 [compost metagenome]